jgi:hypothetical protein
MEQSVPKCWHFKKMEQSVPKRWYFKKMEQSVPKRWHFKKMKQSVPKCWHLNYRSQGITQKKAYDIQKKAKFEIKNNFNELIFRDQVNFLTQSLVVTLCAVC